MCVCVRVRVCVFVGGHPFFESVHARTSVCLRREAGGPGRVSFTHRSVVARCEKDDESFRLPFSNRLDSTGHQAKGKLLRGASAFVSHRLVCFLLIENRRTRFSFRSPRSIAPRPSKRENNVCRHSPSIMDDEILSKQSSKLYFSSLLTKRL